MLPLLSHTQQFSITDLANTPPAQFTSTAVVLGDTSTILLSYRDIYIDDFIAVAQPPRHLPLMNNLLHQLYTVFHDPLPQLHHQTMSQSKLEKGDAVFSTQKHVPGWDINTSTMTLQLPEHRLQSLQIILSTMQSKRRISKHTWR